MLQCGNAVNVLLGVLRKNKLPLSLSFPASVTSKPFKSNMSLKSRANRLAEKPKSTLVDGGIKYLNVIELNKMYKTPNNEATDKSGHFLRSLPKFKSSLYSENSDKLNGYNRIIDYAYKHNHNNISSKKSFGSRKNGRENSEVEYYRQDDILSRHKIMSKEESEESSGSEDKPDLGAFPQTFYRTK